MLVFPIAGQVSSCFGIYGTCTYIESIIVFTLVSIYKFKILLSMLVRNFIDLQAR